MYLVVRKKEFANIIRMQSVFKGNAKKLSRLCLQMYTHVQCFINQFEFFVSDLENIKRKLV